MEQKFEEFLEKAIRNYGHEYFELQESWDEPHQFSERFERKMQKLIGQQKQGTVIRRRLPLRYAVVIAVTAALLFALLAFHAGALNHKFTNFTTEEFKTHTIVQYDGDGSCPSAFENLYEITYLPDGFALKNRPLVTENRSCLNYLYENDTCRIVFRQYLKSEYQCNLNTEGYFLEPVNVNQNEGFCLVINDSIVIVWSDEDYVFQITSNYDKEALIQMAKSVQKAEM